MIQNGHIRISDHPESYSTVSLILDLYDGIENPEGISEWDVVGQSGVEAPVLIGAAPTLYGELVIGEEVRSIDENAFEGSHLSAV